MSFVKIKTDEKTSHIPVNLLTAKASQEDKIDGLVYGADAYLLKPFEVKELLVRIKALVEQREKIRKHFLSNESFGFYDKNISQLDTEFLEKTVKIIETHIGDPEFDNIKLANELAVSRAQLYRKLNSLTVEVPNKLILRIRLDRAAKLVRQNFGNISEVALEVGFNNPSYFSRCFNNKFGKRPSDY